MSNIFLRGWMFLCLVFEIASLMIIQLENYLAISRNSF